MAASKPVEFHPEAEEEYLTSLNWYRERSPVAAANFESAVAGAVDRIKDAPERWPVYFEQFRRYTLHQFPFGIVYCDLGTNILVLAVAHAHRRPGYWRDRA